MTFNEFLEKWKQSIDASDRLQFSLDLVDLCQHIEDEERHRLGLDKEK